MEANAWWLLAIPLFFGLGWVASRLDSAQLFTQTRQLPESYFKGLNFLLNEQHEQAIASFEEVARLDPETADLYFALGNLFRKRGETERAIRIHRNLLERADLPEAQRQQALFCLAQDYLNAGIFDRAESAFSALSGSSFAAQAQRELAKLYEKESNWPAAIACLQQYLTTLSLPVTEKYSAQEDLSHYACELANQHLQAKAYDLAKQSLDLAERSNPSNPRIAFCRAQWCVLQADSAQAINILSPVLSADPRLTALAVSTLLPAKEENADVVPTIQQWVMAYPTADSVKALMPVLHGKQDHQGMLDVLLALEKTSKKTPPQLANASVLLNQAQLNEFNEHATAWQLQAVQTIDQLSSRYDRPTCLHCGFKASRHQWRCPGCAQWNTLPYTAAVLPS